MSTASAETIMAELEAGRAQSNDPDQQHALQRVSGHLAEHGVAALAKTGGPAHLTASCFVFDETLEEVLLTLHRKGQFWVQFGEVLPSA